MSALFQTLLSRRTFVKSGTALSALFLAACSLDSADEEEPEPTATPPSEPDEARVPDPTATPEPTPTTEPTPTPTPVPREPISLVLGDFVDEHQTLVKQTIDALQEIANENEIPFNRVSDPERASVQMHRAHNSPRDDVHIHGEPLVAAVRVDQLVDQVLRDDIPRLFNREIASWQELGGQDWLIHPAIAGDAVPPDFALDSDIQHRDDLTSHAGEHPGLIAMMRRSSASFDVQTLIIDEMDPLRDELTPDVWPWWERIDITVDHPDADTSERIVSRLNEVTAELSASRRTMLSIVGDVMLGRTPHRIMYERNDWRAPYPLVADELQKGDLTIGNLECAITDSFTPPADPTTFSFMTFTSAVEGLQFAGFHALSGANNHALDFGVVGMQDTTAALEAGGIQHFGVGNTLEEARQPCLLEHNGVTFGFLGYDAISMHYAGATANSGGVAPLVQEYFVEDIQRTREIADVVIPYFHWGVEYTLTPTANDRRMSHLAVEAGADLVLGGHPHWVQGMEIYQGTAIFYSTSNFVFDQEWSFETKQGFVLHLVFDGTRLVGYRVVPVLIEDFHRPRIVEDDVRATILGRFWESSSIIASTPHP